MLYYYSNFIMALILTGYWCREIHFRTLIWLIICRYIACICMLYDFFLDYYGFALCSCIYLLVCNHLYARTLYHILTNLFIYLHTEILLSVLTISNYVIINANLPAQREDLSVV